MPTPSNKIEIDFDAASAAWHANKIRRGPRLYYVCTALNHSSGKPCQRIANVATLDRDPTAPHLCTQHLRSKQLR
jgi:hypothetical protein